MASIKLVLIRVKYHVVSLPRGGCLHIFRLFAQLNSGVGTLIVGIFLNETRTDRLIHVACKGESSFNKVSATQSLIRGISD